MIVVLDTNIHLKEAGGIPILAASNFLRLLGVLGDPQ